MTEIASERPILSVVIPNWNGMRFLETCLGSLRQQTYSALQIIVADNASTDGSQSFIRDHFSDVTLVTLAMNAGFTGACNAGIMASTGDFVALLNNDTEVDPNWASAVVSAFSRAPEVGIVASKMLLFDRRNYFHTAGDFFRVDGKPGNRGVWQEDRGQYDEEAYVFSACGGSAVYRRKMLDQIGLLDDDFFFSLEDIDLAWRAQLTGWRCLYTPDAIVYHHLSATGGGKTASYYDGRNLIFVLVKNFPSSLWRKYGLLIFKRQLKDALDALRAWRGEAARARLRGMLAGIIQSPKMLRKRRKIQAARSVELEELERALTPASD